MQNLAVEFQEKLKDLNPIRIIDPDDEESGEAINKVLEVAAWIHHKIVWIHPFRDGNGRVARLMANLVLERYGLIPVSSRVERDNRNAYLEALKQADEMEDYQPLIDFIVEGIEERFMESPHRTYLE